MHRTAGAETSSPSYSSRRGKSREATDAVTRIRVVEPGPPAFEQAAEKIRRDIERGRLLPGDRLPPVRELARRAGLAPNTVARAYRELGEAGWIEGRGRAGTFVTWRPPIRRRDATASLDEAARRYLRRAAQLGFDRGEAARAVRRA